MNPYETHGVNITKEEDNKWIGDCPFCGKEKHWAAFKDDFRYSCFVCGVKGNLYTFMKWLINVSIPQTQDVDYADLSQNRGLDESVLKRFRLCKSILSDEWLLPTYTRQQGKLSCVNIHRFVNTGKGWKLFGTPTCKQHLYNTDSIKSDSLPLIVVEGQWDCMALDFILRQVKERSNYELIAVPGANIFREDHAGLLSGREVILCYDNDEAGDKGMKRVIAEAEKLVDTPLNVSFLQWDVSKGKGYDIRDLL